jgi:hypothetical protein
VQRETELARLELGAKLPDPVGQRPFDRQREVRHTDVKQLLITEIRPIVT